MSTKSDDRYSGQVESQPVQDTNCEVVSADSHGGGKGSKDREPITLTDARGASANIAGRDTRGGGKGSKD